eukprot:353572-Chlamydomonas_euryale.AAC.9
MVEGIQKVCRSSIGKAVIFACRELSQCTPRTCFGLHCGGSTGNQQTQLFLSVVAERPEHMALSGSAPRAVFKVDGRRGACRAACRATMIGVASHGRTIAGACSGTHATVVCSTWSRREALDMHNWPCGRRGGGLDLT